MRPVHCAALLSVALALPVLAKLPPPSDDAKAKAAEAAAKTAWTDKVGAYQLCQSQDRVAADYRKSGKATRRPRCRRPRRPRAQRLRRWRSPACADPGPYVAAARRRPPSRSRRRARIRRPARRPRRRAPTRPRRRSRRRSSASPAPARSGSRARLAYSRRMHPSLRLTAASAPLTHEVEVLDEFGAARQHLDPGRAAADGVRRQARAGHADDAGRGARAAGARLPAQPAPGRLRSTTSTRSPSTGRSAPRRSRRAPASSASTRRPPSAS